MQNIKSSYSLNPCVFLDHLYYSSLKVIDKKIGHTAASVIDIVAPIILSSIICEVTWKLIFSNTEFIKIDRNNPVFVATNTFFFLHNLMLINEFSELFQSKAIEQIICQSKNKEKNALIISAHWNYYDSFYNSFCKRVVLRVLIGNKRLRLFRLNIEKMAKTHSVQHFIAYSETQLHQGVENLRDRTIDKVWIRAHGVPSKIEFNHSFCIDETSTKLMKTIAKKLCRSASIILSACSTGYGDSNIAKTLSTFCPNTIIYAPVDVIGTSHGSYFNDELIPTYFKRYNLKVISRTYYNGEYTSLRPQEIKRRINRHRPRKSCSLNFFKQKLRCLMG